MTGSPDTRAPGTVCDRCGAFGDMPHLWTAGDCVLGHRRHSLARFGFLCGWCIDRHRSWLTEIVELYATLDQVLEPGSVPDDTAEHGHVKKRPASPAPMRLDAWAMLFDRDRLYATGSPSDLPDVPAVVAVHADALWESMFGSERDAPWTLTAAAAHLAANAETAAGQSWIDELDADLHWCRTALRRAHGIANPQPLGHCLTVDCPGRVWPDRQDGRPQCDRCARRYGTLDLVRLHAYERAV